MAATAPDHRPSAGPETAGLQVPGGTGHDGEDPAAAVVREVREETGMVTTDFLTAHLE